MKNELIKKVLSGALLLVCFAVPMNGIADGKEDLRGIYKYVCNISSDIFEHIPVLHDLCQECTFVTEIGVRGIVSTWGCLQGLGDNGFGYGSYLGIDISPPPPASLAQAKGLAEENGITFTFLQADDMTIELPYTDLLFIDSLHTYCHLTYELEHFCSSVGKYIALHDTSAPWGNQDDLSYSGNYSEYPAEYDRTKRGLWPAVEDFLVRHPEWKLKERRLNCHGFTVLERVQI